MTDPVAFLKPTVYYDSVRDLYDRGAPPPAAAA